MNDAAQMGVVHGSRERFDKSSGSYDGLWLATERFFEACAIDKFQSQIGPAVSFADFMNLHDVWMLQLGDDFGFVAKASEFLRAGQDAGANHLESDNAV